MQEKRECAHHWMRVASGDIVMLRCKFSTSVVWGRVVPTAAAVVGEKHVGAAMTTHPEAKSHL